MKAPAVVSFAGAAVLLILSCAGSPKEPELPVAAAESEAESEIDETPESIIIDEGPESSSSGNETRPESSEDDGDQGGADVIVSAVQTDTSTNDPVLLEDEPPAPAHEESAQTVIKGSLESDEPNRHLKHPFVKRPRTQASIVDDAANDDAGIALPNAGSASNPVMADIMEPATDPAAEQDDRIAELGIQNTDVEDKNLGAVTAPAFNPLLAEDIPYEPETPELDIAGSARRTDSTDRDSTVEQSNHAEAPSEMPSAENNAAEHVEETAPVFTPIEHSGGIKAEPEAETTYAQAVEYAEAHPERWLEGPGEFSITLDGQGWVFRSDLSSPGSWRFLQRERNGDSTRFQFLFDDTGSWNLVFEKQDLASGGSLRETRNVRVGEERSVSVEDGSMASSEKGISGELPGDPDERHAAARSAMDSGYPNEAIALWSRDAHRRDSAGRRARAGIVEAAAAARSISPLVEWLPEYLADGADPAVLADVLDVLDEQVGYGEHEMELLEALTIGSDDLRRPEWLYRLARKLEEPGMTRNLDRAASLYSEVIAGWPFSDWRDLSEERLSYLRRHYFRVR